MKPSDELKQLQNEKFIIFILDLFILSLIIIGVFLPLIRSDLSKETLYITRGIILLTSFNSLILLRFYSFYVHTRLENLKDYINDLPF